MLAGFVGDDATKQVAKELEAGNSAIFPFAKVHYQQNLGCEEAELLISYSSEDPGGVVGFPSRFPCLRIHASDSHASGSSGSMPPDPLPLGIQPWSLPSVVIGAS